MSSPQSVPGFFIVGAEQGATTQLRNDLQLHPDVYVAPETHWLPFFYNTYGTQKIRHAEFYRIMDSFHLANGKSPLERILKQVKLTRSDLEDVLRPGLSTDGTDTIADFFGLFYSTLAERSGATIWVDKTPDYGLCMNLLQSLWPGSRFIHIVAERDSVAETMASQKTYRLQAVLEVNHWWSIGWQELYRPGNSDARQDIPPEKFFDLWLSRTKRTRDESRRLTDGTFLEIKVRTLSRKPDEVLTDVAAFMDLRNAAQWVQEAIRYQGEKAIERTGGASTQSQSSGMSREEKKEQKEELEGELEERKRIKFDLKLSTYLSSLVKGRLRSRAFSKVQMFCMFIGYPRSGHSLVGSLLDAHPDAVISHELDALRFVRNGYSRRQLFSLIIDNDRLFTQSGRSWAYGHQYEVADQWQGRFRNLKVIGDKKGGRSTKELTHVPGLLDQLRDLVAVPLRIIHVARNPYDNVATLSMRGKIPLSDTISEYSRLCRKSDELRTMFSPEDWIDLRHEDLIGDPQAVLRRLLAFLDLEPLDDYLKSCAATIHESPHQSREKVRWNDRLVKRIRKLIEKHEFLHGYPVDLGIDQEDSKDA